MPRCVRTAHVFDKKWRSDDVRLQEEASFSSLLLPKKLLIGLENAGYKTPSPIQLESIPVGRFGRDLLVQAKSGTGKTLVFTVIALESLSEIKYPQVLIMAPTREIAIQICDVVRAVGSAFKGLTCNSFIGGTSVDTDIERVHGCQIIVGTPGRLKHLISLGILATNSIRLLVLDEADVLLESNFKDDLDYIFVSLPKEKQVIATSATYPRELRSMTRQYFRKVYLARLNRNELTLLGMVHYIQVLELPKMSVLAYKAKLAALEKVVTSVQFTQCLVFCNLISRVESLCYDIRNWGFTSTFISSAKEQCDRIKAIECLKRFKCKILVTSDVTSRGIDAENVDLVVNFDKPPSTEVYFHRCGRAGRYGSKGVGITFLEKNEVIVFEQMKVKHNLKAYNLPDPIPANLINIRPRDYVSSTENSEDEDSSDEVSKKDSDDLDNYASDKIRNGKIGKKNSCTDPSTICNGKISSGLNGHVVENNNVNESTSSDKNANCNGECIDVTNEKCDCTMKNLRISSDLDIMEHSVKSEVVDNNHANIENGKGSCECTSNVNNASEISVTNEIVKEKNSFLDYLQSGPKNAESIPSSHSALVSDSGVIINKISTDHVLSLELKSNTILEANNSSLQNEIQHSSEMQCLNNVNNLLEAENNDKESEDFNQYVCKEEIKENLDELIPPSDILLTNVENNVISVDTSTPTFPNTSASNKVSEECSNETKNKFVPNKIQISVGKFLIKHMDNCDINNLESNNSNSTEVDLASNKDCSANETETEQNVTKALKGIRKDLSEFYSKVYKAYQAENINNDALEDIKAVVMQQKEGEVKKSANKSIVNSNAEISFHGIKDSDEKITSETIPAELNKENCQNPADLNKENVKYPADLNKENCQNPANLKFCDITECNDSLYLVVSNDSTSSAKNNTSEVGQVDRHVFKDNSADNSLSSSDSSSNENSYLALKSSYDSMKASEKANSKTNLDASRKNDKAKRLLMKKKKFSLDADQRQHSSPVSSKKQSDSECSSVNFLHEDTENELGDQYGARRKVHNEKQNFRHGSDTLHRAENNKPRCKNKAKPHSAAIIKEDTSTPYFKRSKSANNGCPHTTNAVNCGSIPSTSRHHDCTASAVNYGNIPFANQPHGHTRSAVNYESIPSTSRHHDCTANYGNIPFTCQPHGHTRSAVNYGSSPSMNHHHVCQLPNYPCSHQTNGYAPPHPAANQVNISHAGHHQFGNASCHNCSVAWYQIYMKQWQFIHSSLF